MRRLHAGSVSGGDALGGAVLNPWAVPLMMSSASVIAMRTWMQIPAGGQPTAWQRREAARMVDEKVDAVRESQAEAVAIAMRVWFNPWAVWGPINGDGVHGLVAEATESMVAPFARRADANMKRLAARAAEPMIGAAWPVAALEATVPAALAALQGTKPPRRRRAAR